MRVAVVCPIPFGADGIYGGGTRYPEELARALAGRVSCDLVVFGEEHGEEVDHHGLRHVVVRDPTRVKGNVDPVSLRLARAIADHDVVHFHTVNKSAVAGAALSRMRGSRAFLTPLGGGGRVAISRLNVHRVFDGFPVISRFTMVECPWIAPRPHAVIYGGGDAAGFGRGPTSGETRRAHRVVCVGRISPHKGVDVLIKALPDGAELVVCGEILDDDYAVHLHRLARGRPVEFVAAAGDDLVSDLYASAAVAVMPSLYEDFRGSRHSRPELLGLVLLEAMWHSTPVVASRVGGIPEIVQEGENGFLVDAGDVEALTRALERLLADSSLAATMGAAGRRLVEDRFTWASVAERALSFYETVARDRRARR